MPLLPELLASHQQLVPSSNWLLSSPPAPNAGSWKPSWVRLRKLWRNASSAVCWNFLLPQQPSDTSLHARPSKVHFPLYVNRHCICKCYRPSSPTKRTLTIQLVWSTTRLGPTMGYWWHAMRPWQQNRHQNRGLISKLPPITRPRYSGPPSFLPSARPSCSNDVPR